jgi:prepilin-type N-terminal cleavage/methylation domain-containing protein
MQIRTAPKVGFTLVEIMIVVAIIGVLAAIAIPNFVTARKRSQTNACIANLKQIEGCKETWALDNKKQDTDTPSMATDLVPKYTKSEPICPAGTAAYIVGSMATRPTCPNVGTEPNHVLP